MVRARLPRKLRPLYRLGRLRAGRLEELLLGPEREAPRVRRCRPPQGFLAGVVRNKVQEQHRRLTRTEKYDLSREEQLYIRRGDREIVREVASPDPSPSETMQAADRLEQLTAGCSQRDIDVLTLRRHGLTHVEIAERIGMDERSVRRFLEAFRSRLEGQR